MIAAAAVRLLIRLFPRDVRVECGVEMAATCRRRVQMVVNERGRCAGSVCYVRECGDLVRSALREHARARVRSHERRPRSSDVAFSLRQGINALRRAPSYSATVVVTLAMAIAANTAVFSMVKSVLLVDLPFDEPNRLVKVWEHNYVRGNERNVVNQGNFSDWRDQNTVFTDMAIYLPNTASLSGEGVPPESRAAALVSANFFEVLGGEVLRGRGFLPNEGEPGQADVVVISESLWQSWLGGADDVIGRTVSIDERSYTVVGVLPRGTGLPADTDVWRPLAFGERWYTRTGRWGHVVARLAPHADLASARLEMDVIGRRLEEEYPAFNAGYRVNVVPLFDELVGSGEQILAVLMGTVAFALLVACFNAANLAIGRATARTAEFAVRRALGARASVLFRQVFVESVLLAGLACALGVALAQVAIEVLVASAPADIPRLDRTTIDLEILGFSMLISVVTAVAFGTMPAWLSSRGDVTGNIRGSGRGTVSSSRSRLMRGLVVLQITAAFVLLVGAGLFLRSFLGVLAVDVGVNSESVISGRLTLPRGRYADAESWQMFFASLQADIDGLPDVVSSSAISYLPFNGPGAAQSYTLDDRPEPTEGNYPVADVRGVLPNYFETMGIPIFEGGTFDGTERPDADVFPVVVNRAMAQSIWPEQSAIGKRLTMEWFGVMHGEVIGVVGDVRHYGPESGPAHIIYWVYAQFPSPAMNLVVRTAGAFESVVAPVRSAVARQDSRIPLADVQQLSSRLNALVAQRRFSTYLMTGFAGLAFLTAMVGLYAVISQNAVQRRREWGLRMALGADRRRVLLHVMTMGASVGVIAVGLGLVSVLGLSRAVEALLFGIEPLDAPTLMVVAGILAAVTALASFMPAAEATRVDPVKALRID